MATLIDNKAEKLKSISLVQYGTPQLLTSNVKSEAEKKEDIFRIRDTRKARKTYGLAACEEKEEDSSFTDQDILNLIKPPKQWTEKRKVWRQQISSVPAAKQDTSSLKHKMEALIKSTRSDAYGTCTTRGKIFAEAFDELIRHVAVTCSERGLLLILVRNDLRGCMRMLKKLYTSANSYGLRKILQSRATEDKLMIKIDKLKQEVEQEKKIYEEALPQMQQLKEQHFLTSMQTENEYLEELERLVKRKNQLKLLVQQSVGVKKKTVKPRQEHKQTLKEKLAGSLLARKERPTIRSSVGDEAEEEEDEGHEEEIGDSENVHMIVPPSEA